MQKSKLQFKIKNYKIQNLKQGQAALTAVIFFLFSSLGLIAGFVSFAASDFQSSNLAIESKKSFIFAEGAIEDAIYRIKTGKNMPSQVVYESAGLSATTTVSGERTQIAEVESVSLLSRAFRKSMVAISQGENVSFSYAAQIDEGGLQMASNSVVNGNVYTNGSITGSSNSAIYGDAYAAGVISAPSPSVSGIKYPGAEPQSMPPIDIEYWRLAANQNNDPITGDYTINRGSQDFGPRKITGNFKINGNANVTLLGPLYVMGDFEMNNNTNLYLSDSFGSLGTVIIVDGSVKLNSNSVIHSTNADPRGHILILSVKSGEAIELNSNSVAGAIYAVNGEIEVNDNVESVMVAGYRIVLNSNAEINYDSGLQSAYFSGSPSSLWTIDSWRETP